MLATDREAREDWKKISQGAVEQPRRTYTDRYTWTTRPPCTFVMFRTRDNLRPRSKIDNTYYPLIANRPFQRFREHLAYPLVAFMPPAEITFVADVTGYSIGGAALVASRR